MKKVITTNSSEVLLNLFEEGCVIDWCRKFSWKHLAYRYFITINNYAVALLNFNSNITNMKKPFNINDYNTGEYDVVARDGRDVVIYTTDHPDKEFPIVGCVDCKIIVTWSFDGHYFNPPVAESDSDLFLVKDESKRIKELENKIEQLKKKNERLRKFALMLNDSLLKANHILMTNNLPEVKKKDQN